MRKILKTPSLNKTIRGLLLILLSVLSASSCLMAQTASFNFSAASNPVSGWTNMAGDPSVGIVSATDAATGVSLTSIATANWHPLDNSAFDGYGAANGTFFPAAVMLNHWYQYNGSVSAYNPSSPQLRISGLKAGTFYTLRMAGSSTSSANSNPTRYTVAGGVVYDYRDVNSHNNTADGAVFNHVVPDASGILNVYVNTLSTTDVGDICGLQIIKEPSYWSAAGNAGLDPALSFLGTQDANPLPFRTNNQERMRIQPDGHVLIGSTTDDGDGAVLQVSGTQSIDVGSISSEPLNINTNNIFSPWVNLTNINTAVGASIGMRYYNANGLVAQFFAGGPTNPYMPNGFAFHDISGSGFDFVSANPSGFISWGSNFHNMGGSKMIFYPTSGNLLIGSTTDNGSRLQVNGNASVNGTITTKVVKVTPNGWSDYVFDSAYKLPSLAEIELYVKANKHLPDVVSAAQVQQKGVDLGENQAAQLKKIEELTLYMIELNKKVETLTKENRQLKKMISRAIKTK